MTFFVIAASDPLEEKKITTNCGINQLDVAVPATVQSAQKETYNWLSVEALPHQYCEPALLHLWHSLKGTACLSVMSRSLKK